MDTPRRLRFLLGCFLCLPLAVVFYQVGSAGHDDSHITFWQAWTLNHQGALLNYNGERIEQSSSLLQVILTAWLARLTGIDEASSGYLINAMSSVVTVLLCYTIAMREKMPLAWLPALLTSGSIYFSYWAFSGMETTLAALCVLLFIDQCRLLLLRTTTPTVPAMLTALTSSALLAAVRPEMMLIGPAWLLLLAALYPQKRSPLLLMLFPFAVLLLWRYQYFGQWFPNPVYAKSRGIGIGPLLEQTRSGFAYLQRLGRHPASLGLAAIFTGCIVISARSALAYWRQEKTHPMLLWLLWTIIYTAFVISSGGDWMKDGRFWVPLIAPAALVAGSVMASFQPRLRLVIIFLTLLLQQFHANAFIERFNFGMQWPQQAQWQPVFPKANFFERSNREHLRDLPAIARLEYWIPQLHAQEQQPVTLMSKQMGLVNYTLATQYSGKFRVMDMAGLVENSLRNCDVMTQDGFEKQGMNLNYHKFFSRLPEARSRCQIEAPDIIYDIYGWGEAQPLPEYLETQGYRIVFHQTGRINMKPGSDVTAHEIIAIKAHLLGSRATHTEHLDFNALLPQ